jgi:hypothetical protein
MVLDCAGDPHGGLREMFVDRLMGPRIAAGQRPVLRPVFRKAHGIASGRFVVRPDLPDELRVGLFAGGPYRTWVRFSSDVAPEDPDLHGTCGIALKLFGPEGATHDFVLQNHDVFFVDTAREMCEFTQAIFERRVDRYRSEHPTTDRVLEEMKKVVASVLTTPYWGILPHRFGDGRHAKYKLEPVDPAPSGAPATGERDHLGADLLARLRAGPARFRFLVQLRTHADAMPLDAATVRWDEAASPPEHVATLLLDRQDVAAPGQPDYGEGLSFSIWRTPREQEPVGSIAEARRVAYVSAADLRRRENGVPLEEPAEPRAVAA